MPRSSAEKARASVSWGHRLSLTLAARDPGRARLVVAAAVALGVLASALLAEIIIRRLNAEGSLLVVAIFLSVQAGNMAKDRSALGRLGTTALLIPAVVLSILLAAALSPSRILAIGVFVAVSGVAIWIRRFGERAASLGAIAFMGYFFALFMKPSGHELFAFCVIAASSVATQAIIRAALLLKRPRRELALLLQQFRAASEAAIDATSSFHHPGLLRARLARVDEISGAIWSWQQTFSTEHHILVDAQTLDDRVLDARVATEEACYELAGMAGSARETQRERAEAQRLRATFAEAVRGKEDSAAIRWAENVAAGDQKGASALPAAVFLVAGAVVAQVRLRRIDLTQPLTEDIDVRTQSRPAAQQASSPTAVPLGSKAHWSSWPSTSRMAAQVMIATAIAAGVGEMISASRWYWAVMTAFVIFIGATTRSGILTRAFRRISGTLLGIAVGVIVVFLVGENTIAVVTVCVLGVFGMLYFGPLNYLYSALFLTTMLVSMYRLLGVLDSSVLELRLEETVAGAVVGVLCAYLIASTNSRPLLLAKVNDYANALDVVLRCAVAPSLTSTSKESLNASLHALEARQTDLDQVTSGMVMAFLVSAPREVSATMHLMHIITRSAARLVQIQSPPVRWGPRVMDSVAELMELVSDVRRAMCSSRSRVSVTAAGSPQVINPRRYSLVELRSIEAEALSAISRMRWALLQIIGAKAGSLG